MVALSDIVVVHRCIFLSLRSSNFNIIIDRLIGVLGHGKDIVDAINACDKRYLKGKTCTVWNP